MIKPIFIYGEPILRRLSTNYDVGTDLSGVIQDLWDTMYNADGAGLSGAQIGIGKRIFVIDLPDQKWKKVFINPLVEPFGDYSTRDEGCLSLPGINGPIMRLENAQIEYYDENWKLHTESYKGIRARVIQHEFDHLDGVLWVDRAGQELMYPLTSKLRKFKEKDFEATYPTA